MKVEISGSQRTFKIEGKTVKLTVLLFDILYYMAMNRGEVISREKLLSNVWPNTYRSGRTVDVHISKLRNVLPKYFMIDGDKKEPIESVISIGYKFNMVVDFVDSNLIKTKVEPGKVVPKTLYRSANGIPAFVFDIAESPSGKYVVFYVNDICSVLTFNEFLKVYSQW